MCWYEGWQAFERWHLAGGREVTGALPCGGIKVTLPEPHLIPVRVSSLSRTSPTKNSRLPDLSHHPQTHHDAICATHQRHHQIQNPSL